MKLDYGPFLHVLANGSIWWPLEDAIKLGAGYLPVCDDERNLIPTLWANSNRVRANERTLLSEFSRDHFDVTHPMLWIRDDGRYVEAREFLDWLTGIAHDQAFPFPHDLANAVKLALDARAARGPGFESSTAALDAWFDTALGELPEQLRCHVEENFFPAHWDQLSPTERRSVAVGWDDQNQAAMDSQHPYWWNFFIRLDGIAEKIDEWKSDTTSTLAYRKA